MASGFWENKGYFRVEACNVYCFYEAQGGFVNLGLSYLGAVNLAVGADAIRGDHV